MSESSETNESADKGGLAAATNGPKARVILQQCTSAKLQVQPATAESPAQFVEIARGIVVYVCFLNGAAADTVEKIAKTVLNLRLSEADDSGKLVSVLELPGDILIIPQATLGGRAKGRTVQYHGNINKQLGEQLYAQFVDRCREAVEQSSRQSAKNQCVVRCGTYGNRQVLSMDTNGPYSHILEI